MSRFATQTSRSASAKGSGRSNSVFTTLNTVELAPMPNPAIRMIKVVSPASRLSDRKV